MKRILAMRSFIGVIAVALVFSFTMLSTNSSVYAQSSTAEVTHVEVSANGKVIKELKKETFAYPIGEEFDKHMSQFDGYMLSGISSSSKSIDGAEKVVAKVEWQKIENKEEQKNEKIPYETKEKKDPALNKGEKVVEQEGVAGEKTVTYKVTYVGGIERSREVISEEVTVDPVEEITRVGTKVTEVKEEQKTEEIPYETIQKEDPELDKGEKVIDQKGVTGEKVTTYKLTYVNGEEVSREAITEEITVEPKEEIIRVGTKTNGSNDGSENDGDKSEGDDTSGSNDSNETDDDNTTGTKNDDGLSGVKESETDNNGNSDNATGERLPNTATNIFNIGLIGIALLFSGILITLFRRFKGSKA
ncbi:G5 domain-containing protein [Virgibacillus pantothenticus]|uniref:G5 domain-containing protein n=1 Tax=Virgibacillus pantothenticus TaxID=1473 RepID=UPI0025B02D44|nr:G5 domain-containing protein [Virgibacillus pantothenticus]